MSWTAIARIAGIAAASALLLTACAGVAPRTEAVQTACFDSSDGVRLCYRGHLLDDPAKPLLVFIPGWTMPASLWERQLAHFAGRYSVVAFDPRGQGESAAPDSGYTLDRRTQDIHELLDRFPGRPVVLVGWSLAVLESLAYVDRYGEGRLSGLVLVDNSIGEGPAGPEPTGENPFFAELRADREDAVRKFAAAIFRNDPGAAVRERVVASALKTRVEDSIRLLSYGKPRTYWKENIYRVTRPILYLVTPRYGDQAQALAHKHPDAATRIFADARHALFWDEADAFNLVLDEFMQRLAAGQGPLRPISR